MIEYTARITSTDTPRVGGRNLIRAGYFNKLWFGSDTSKSLTIDNEEMKITIVAKDRWNSWTWLNNLAAHTTIDLKQELGEYTLSFSVRGRGTFEFGVIADYPNRESGSKVFRTITEDWQRVSISFKRTIEASSLFYAQSPNRDYGVVGDWVQFADDWKLERGTVATDWTPAPEDVADSISTVNTSLVSLASTLLDPDQGEIHKLTDLLDKHKTDTDKNFEDLATHPLTIDDKGYWQIWSVKDSKYLTTQYQSRGEAGKDAGRYLGRAKRIHPDLNGNYLLEPEGSSWQTAKEGDYVYLVGDLSNRGGDKDTYYIVREHKSKTVWEVYNIKGRTAHIEWHGTSLVVDDQPPVDLRGEAGHSPSPEEVLGTSRFAELLGGEVTSKVTPLSKEIDKSNKYAVDLINETQTQLCDLQVLGMSDGGVIEVKRQAACCHYDYLTPSIGSETNPPQPPKPKYIKQQIPLTLRSSHDALSKQVSNLQMQLTSYIQQFNKTKEELAQLKADTTITPILNADTRKRGSTLYPRYGDWLLTSDSQEQYISFSGLPASIGKSIYIQTRRKAYLNANGHSFFGLPGTSSSAL